MFRLLPVLLVFWAQATFAVHRCDELFAPQNLRIELDDRDLRLIPLNRAYAEQLREVLSDEDVSRFFVGPHTSIDEVVRRHLNRAEQSNGGNRDSYDGLWIITQHGEVGGYLMMTAVDPAWLPIAVQAEFQKARPEDLYLVVGYALDPSFRGRGIASRALGLAMEFAKSTLKAKFAFASANNLNPSSSQVLLRAGFSPIHSDAARTKYLRRLE